jgi:hypothetical protein
MTDGKMPSELTWIEALPFRWKSFTVTAQKGVL